MKRAGITLAEGRTAWIVWAGGFLYLCAADPGAACIMAPALVVLPGRVAAPDVDVDEPRVDPDPA